MPLLHAISYWLAIDADIIAITPLSAITPLLTLADITPLRWYWLLFITPLLLQLRHYSHIPLITLLLIISLRQISHFHFIILHIIIDTWLLLLITLLHIMPLHFHFRYIEACHCLFDTPLYYYYIDALRRLIIDISYIELYWIH